MIEIKKKFFFVIICFSFAISFAFFVDGKILASGLGDGFDYSVVPKGGSAYFSNQTSKIWNTAIFVVRILVFLGIFIVGLRYMFASPNQKGEIKKSSIALIIGMVLVFTATQVIEFVVETFNYLI